MRTSENLKLLIVDPSDTERFMMRSVLVEHNFQVLLAKNAEEGLMMTRKLHPDLIITDCGPRIDGAEFCRQVRQEMEISEIAIVLMSSYPNSSQTSLMRLFEAGCDQVLYKPFKFKDLSTAIELALKRADCDNMIPVLYKSGEFARVSPANLDQLIMSGKILCFKRQARIAVINRDPVRENVNAKYYGPERRRAY